MTVYHRVADTFDSNVRVSKFHEPTEGKNRTIQIMTLLRSANPSIPNMFDSMTSGFRKMALSTIAPVKPYSVQL
jgi:hypothetical protein